MGELRPLGRDLTKESRALAEVLRELFEGLGVSVRRYAARRQRDPGTFSRYLNGTRMPPWSAIMDMLTDLAEHRGTTVTPETIEYVRGLYESAFDANSSPKHAAQIIEQQLADADHVSRRSSVRGDVLGDALLDRKHRIADWTASTASPTWRYASTRWRRRSPPSGSGPASWQPPTPMSPNFWGVATSCVRK